jgi:hypothetical protein
MWRGRRGSESTLKVWRAARAFRVPGVIRKIAGIILAAEEDRIRDGGANDQFMGQLTARYF